MPEEVNFCPRCGQALPPGSLFCPYCGLDVRFLRDVPPSPEGGNGGTRWWDRLMTAMGAWTSLLILLVLALNVVLAVWGARYVLPEIGAYGISIFVIVPDPTTLFRVYDWAAVLLYLVFLVAVVVSFIYLVYQSKDRIVPELKGESEGEKSPLFALCTLFVALVAFQTLYYLVMLNEVEINTPDVGGYSLWMQLYVLLRASVWEEVITRILYIGVPVLIISWAGKRMDHKWYQYLLGGFGIDRLSIVFIIASSVMFGLGHVAGWDYYKVIPSMLAGLGMGYLFVKYGVHAAIMLHFAFDYLSVPTLMSGSILVTVMLGMLMLFMIAVGIPFFAYYVKEGAEAVTGKAIALRTRNKEDGGDAEYMYIPRPVCPQCGNDKVRVLEEGEFECLRCGKRF